MSKVDAEIADLRARVVALEERNRRLDEVAREGVRRLTGPWKTSGEKVELAPAIAEDLDAFSDGEKEHP